MVKNREQLKRELKQEYFAELSALQESRERLLKDKEGELENIDNQIEALKLKMEVLSKLQ